MNINVLIDKLKNDTGLNGYLGKVYPDTLLRDSILNNSLNTFNLYSGCHITINFANICNMWNSTPILVNDQFADIAYRIPDQIMDRFKELGVEIKNASIIASNRNILPNVYSRGMVDDIKVFSWKYRESINYPKARIKFKAPHTLIAIGYGMFNSYYSPNETYNVVLECTHPKNLSTISFGLQSYFEDLCKYDILINLYNNDLRNLKVDLGSSSVDLQLENFQNAESDRKELLSIIKQKAATDHTEIMMNM